MNTTDPLCTSCGMPMEKEGDFPLGDRSKAWCVHCARADAALTTARGLMARFPAWKNRA